MATMTSETLATAGRRNLTTSSTKCSSFRDMIYCAFFSRVQADQCTGYYGRTNMGL